jgi:hypothetical protein
MQAKKLGAGVLASVLAAAVVLAFGTSVRADSPELIEFQVGNATGTIQEANDDRGAVQIITLVPSNGRQVVFQFDKVWTVPSEPTRGDSVFTQLATTPVGVPAGPTRAIIVFLPSAEQAGQEYFDIILGDEQLSNQSSVVWTDFHITVDVLVGDGEATLSGTPRDLDRLPQWQLSHADGAGQLDFFGGQWANDGAFDVLFQSDLKNDPVKVRIALGERPTQLIIKEWPTVPEPATMSLLGLGFLPVVLRRKRR